MSVIHLLSNIILSCLLEYTVLSEIEKMVSSDEDSLLITYLVSRYMYLMLIIVYIKSRLYIVILLI